VSRGLRSKGSIPWKDGLTTLRREAVGKVVWGGGESGKIRNLGLEMWSWRCLLAMGGRWLCNGVLTPREISQLEVQTWRSLANRYSVMPCDWMARPRDKGRCGGENPSLDAGEQN
jgi:hypothetical protein